MKSGIYAIVHKPSQRCYVGQSQDIDQRIYDHLNNLANCKHPNEHLQSAWDKYGESQFEFKTIEFCSIDKLPDREQFWIESLNSEFNKSRCTTAFWRGMKHSKETKEVMRKRLKGNCRARGFRHTEEAKARISASSKGRKHSDQTKRKMSEAKKGKNLSEEHRKRLSESHKNNPATKLALEKAAEALRGKPWSEERKKEMSEKLKGRVKSEEHLRKIAEAKRGTRHSEESKQKMRESRRRYLERKKKHFV